MKRLEKTMELSLSTFLRFSKLNLLIYVNSVSKVSDEQTGSNINLMNMKSQQRLKSAESNKYVELISNMYNLKTQCLGANI